MIFRRSQLFQAPASGFLHRRPESISKKSCSFLEISWQEWRIVQKLSSGEGQKNFKIKISNYHKILVEERILHPGRSMVMSTLHQFKLSHKSFCLSSLTGIDIIDPYLINWLNTTMWYIHYISWIQFSNGSFH